MAFRNLTVVLVACGLFTGVWEGHARAAPPPVLRERGPQPVPADLRAMIERIRSINDNEGLPIFLIDKVAARLYVFDPAGTLLGDAPVLLGAARGDRSVPGIGDRPLSQVRPEEKTTPAGRFRAERGFNLSGEDIVWVDYDAAVSMHRLRPVSVSERRRERLATPTPLDNRISFGCINVPEKFYEAVVDPALLRGKAMVYILPEVDSLAAVFGPALAADKVGRQGVQQQAWPARPVNLTSGVKP